MIDNISDDSQITEVSPENGEMQDDKVRRMTSKETRYVQAIASGMTKRDAVKAVYDVKPDAHNSTIDSIAQKVEKRPAVMKALENAQEEAQQSVIEVMRYSTKLGSSGTREGASYAQVALVGANSVLDRVFGKAKQSIDVQSTSVTINIDLTQ